MREVEAIILAGGYGRRMGSLTERTQKCLLPIDGKPALGHVIDALVAAFDSVDLKIGTDYRREDVEAFVEGYKPRTRVKTTYVPHEEGEEGWEIYGGMRDYMNGGPFIAAPGDIITKPEAYQDTMNLFQQNANAVEGAITLSPEHNVDTHGIGNIRDSEVTELQWPPPEVIDPNSLRDMTIWSSDMRIFDTIEQYPSPKKSIGVVFMKAIRERKSVAGNLYRGKWIHLGYPADLKKSMQNGVINRRLK